MVAMGTQSCMATTKDSSPAGVPVPIRAHRPLATGGPRNSRTPVAVLVMGCHRHLDPWRNRQRRWLLIIRLQVRVLLGQRSSAPRRGRDRSPDASNKPVALSGSSIQTTDHGLRLDVHCATESRGRRRNEELVPNPQ